MLVCTECANPYKPVEIGITVEEQLKHGALPYKLWAADLYRCACGREIAVTSVGQEPIAEHFQPNYEAIRSRKVPRVIVLV